MTKSAIASLAAACLMLCGSAVGQAQRPAEPVGSAGEAAAPVGQATAGIDPILLGAVVANPGSFQMQPVTQKVDITDAMMLDSDRSDDWILHGRTYDNQRFSPFTDINKSNVRQLRPTAIIQTGITKTTEMTPIEVDGVLYLETGDNNIQAYDAITGKELWAYAPKLGYSNQCCGQQSRGVAVAYGKVFAAQLDGHVVALDARTGKMIWKTDHANALPQPAYFYSFTMAPIAFNGMILVGNAGAEWPTRGFPGSARREYRQAGLALQHHCRTRRAGRQELERRQLEIWRRLGVEHARHRREEQFDPVRHRQSQSRPGWRQPQGRQRLYRLHRRHRQPGPANFAGGTSRSPMTFGTMMPARPVVLFDTLDENGKTVPAAAEAGKVGNVFILNRLTGKLIRKSPPIVTINENFMKPLTTTPMTIHARQQGRRDVVAAGFFAADKIFLHHGRERGA